MANQVELSKLVPYAYAAPPADNASVTKLVMYVWAMPGSEGEDTSNKQGHVFSQVIRRG